MSRSVLEVLNQAESLKGQVAILDELLYRLQEHAEGRQEIPGNDGEENVEPVHGEPVRALLAERRDALIAEQKALFDLKVIGVSGESDLSKEEPLRGRPRGDGKSGARKIRIPARGSDRG